MSYFNTHDALFPLKKIPAGAQQEDPGGSFAALPAGSFLS